MWNWASASKLQHFIFFDNACKTSSTKVRLNNEALNHLRVQLEAALRLPLDSYTQFAILEILKQNLQPKT